MALTGEDDDARVRRAIEAYGKRYADVDLDRDDLRQIGRIADWRTAGKPVGVRITAVRQAMQDERRASMTWKASRAATLAKPREAVRFMNWTEAADLWIDVENALKDKPSFANLIDARHRLGMSHPEAAKVFGIGTQAVTKRLAAAHAGLLAAIGPSYIEEYGRSVPMRRPERWHVRAKRPGGGYKPGVTKRSRSNARTVWANKIRLIDERLDALRRG